MAARTADEAVAVAEVGAAVFRNGTWQTASPAPPFLATAVIQGENEMIAAGFNGGLARTDLTPQPTITSGSAEYGSDVKLVGNLFSDQSATYQWYTGAGVLIPGATKNELTVSHITPVTSDYQLMLAYPGTNNRSTLGVTVPLYPAGQTEVRDPSFIPVLPRPPSVVTPQVDGKLLVAGSFTVSPAGGATSGLARLNADGSLDQSFRAGDGIAATASIAAMHVLADGRIYVRGNFTTIAGQSRAGLARLLRDGTPDPGFNPATFADPLYRSALAPDGRLYVQSGDTSGYNSAYKEPVVLARLALDGSRDATFAPAGKNRLVGVDAQGRVLAENFDGSSPLLVRYLADGTRDSSYAATSVTRFTTVEHGTDELAVTCLTDTGLYAAVQGFDHFAGLSWSFEKFQPNGGRDPSYQPPPGLSLLAGYGASFAYRPDGGLWRVAANGGPRAYFATSYSVTGQPDSTRHATRPDQSDYQILAVAADGSLLVVGNRFVGPGVPTFMRIRPVTGRGGRLTNLSVRALVAGEPLITGFVTSGSDSTSALARAIGPGLAPFGVSDALRDPRLALVRDGATVASNDNWDNALAPRFVSVGAFALPSGSKDAALESNVGPGNYTAVITAPSADNGTALAELYQSADPFVAPRRFVNISARGTTDAAHPLVAGFTITGEVPVSVLVRAAGPALAQFGVSGVLVDPQLTLFRGTFALWDNDNWSDLRNSNANQIVSSTTQVGAFSFPSGSKDSAMFVTLAPGSYTAVVTGANNTSGVALVEVYEVP